MTRGAANRRIALLAGAFLVLLGAALARAFWLQVVQGDAYAAMATRQHRETIVVPAGRGTIFDRNGEPLAIGEQATTVFANPRQVDRPRDLTLAIAEKLDLPPAAVYPLLTDRSKGFVYVARKVDPGRGRSAREAGLQRARLLLGGAPLVPTEASRVAGARLRGVGQRRPRGPRALARSRARRGAGQPDDRERPDRARPRRRLDEARDPGAEHPPHDRPPDPGERRGRARRDRAPSRGAGRLRHRDGSSYRRRSRDGVRAGLQRQPLSDDPRRSPPQPSRDRYVRARVDLQAGDRRGGARGERRAPRDRRSGCRRPSRSRIG